MADTLDLWRGDFGTTYHARNVYAAEDVRPLFQRILGEYEPFDRILEVGCGCAHNLAAIQAVKRHGVEPNQAAREEALARYPAIAVIDGDAAHLPYADDTFDLVLTCGLLIHVPPADVRQAVEEISRVANRLVLFIEYASPDEQEVEYRGHHDILWKRDYGKLGIAWGGLTLVAREPADSLLHEGCEWWLLRKGER